MSPSSPYTITESLSHGRGAVLFRAVRNADHRPVILKVLDARRSRPKDLERLKHEYEIGARIASPAAVKPLALETYQGMPALVFEDFGGQSLDRLLGAPMAMERFLPLAIAIAGAVFDVHQAGIVHKDLKPDNILVNTASREVKLADFGLASSLPREHLPAQPPQLIEGSLPYLSPEQTGRTNRTIDNRADLYSLGVTFYQMLTGRLPFEAKDPVEWVHCHVARAPPSPAEAAPGVPEAIARIVLKLLSKTPEDRYQSARGLRLDLERCIEEWSEGGGIEPFTPGERDVSERLRIPPRLYGRDAEIARSIEAFGRVVETGMPELLLVSGYAGIGKSSLVRELEEPVARTRGFFISGKFDQYKRDIPYATIVQAFRELVREILAGSDEQVTAWKERLLAALGIHAQLVVDVIPEVALVVGRQPRVPELPPIESQNRFRMALRHFIGVFARKDRPLALFLDDLQWADSASLGLIKDLMTHEEMRNLLIVGAYRDNEVTVSHPLMLTLGDVRKAGSRVSEIVLGPIPREHLAALIGDALHCRPEDAAPLADLVDEKTGGNPFFTIQFLTSLYDERLIELDDRAEAFRWDVAKIRDKGFTDNVVDLMVGRLTRLPANAQRALKELACLGNSADVATLTMIHGGAEGDTHVDLSEAVRAGLVLRLDSEYRFLHDRVQEAAYSLIPEGGRALVHLEIGRLLSSRTPPSALDERIFEIVNQIDRGAALIASREERERAAELNLVAGKRARGATAYASALSYFAAGAGLLGEDRWDSRYELAFALELHRAECQYLVGDFDHADALLRPILENARSPLDRATAYRMRARLYQLAGRHRDAVTVTVLALRLFGFAIPESDEEIAAAAEAEIQEVQDNLRGRTIADLAHAPSAKDPHVRAIIGLLAEAMPIVYTARPALWPLITVKGVNLCLRHGNADESPFVYSCYAMIRVAIQDDIEGAVQFSEMAIGLNEQFHSATLIGKLLFHHGAVINVWHRHFATSLPLMDRAFLACLDAGDLVCAGYLTYNMVWLLFESGDALDHVIEVARKYAAFAKQTHNDVVYQVVRIEEQFAASLKGTTRTATSFDDDAFDEAASVAVLERASFGLGVAYYHIMKQIAAFTHGRYAAARQAAARAAPMLREVASMANAATYHFYDALTLASLHAGASAEEQRRFAEILGEQQRKMKHWAEHCPENFRNRYALVSAEIARIEGRDVDAEHLYEEAIRSARESGFVHHEALAYEIASRFYRGRALDTIADGYLREARARFARWGADGKVSQIDQQHPRLLEPRSFAPAVTVTVRPEQFDLYSVTKASQTISGEIVLDKLLRTLLEIVLAQGGAERACFILRRNETFSIEAEAKLDENGAVTTVLEPMSIDTSRRIPASIVRYVHRTKERVFLGDDDDARKFAADDYLARRRPRSALCLPIVRQTEVVGVLYLENDLLAGAFTPARVVALELLGTQAAISLENALLLQRSAFLAEAGEILAASLDLTETLVRLGRLCVRSLSDFCVIDLVDGKEIRRVCSAHRDPAKEPLLEELEQRYPARWDSTHPASAALRTGAPLLFSKVSDEQIRSTTMDVEHARLLRELRVCSGIVVPLAARGQIIGVLSLSSSVPGRYGRADLDLTLEVARRAASAIDNARLYRAAQEAVRARSEFLTVASHELNTPLTSLLLAANALRRGAAPTGRPMDPEAMDKLLQLVLRQTSRLVRLVADLLDVSRIETGRLPLELTDVDLGALVDEVVSRFEVDLARSRCSVSIRVDAPVVGRWDRSRVDRMITNLLSNAIKFGAGKAIEVVIGAERSVARLLIRDHGIGIDEAQQARIFGPFERAVSARHYGGLGLGLYISRKIAEEHGGSVRCESRPGAGSTFIVELPSATPS